eukprot:COSAG05_NODE_3339_length_2141_cov_5.190500_3_plen_65_part_00
MFGYTARACKIRILVLFMSRSTSGVVNACQQVVQRMQDLQESDAITGGEWRVDMVTLVQNDKVP